MHVGDEIILQSKRRVRVTAEIPAGLASEFVEDATRGTLEVEPSIEIRGRTMAG